MNIFSILRNLDGYLIQRGKMEAENYLAMQGSMNISASRMANQASPWTAKPQNLSGPIQQPDQMTAELSSMLHISFGSMGGMGLDEHHDASGNITGWDSHVGDMLQHHDASGNITGWDHHQG